MKELTPGSVLEVPGERLSLDTTGILFFDFLNSGKKFLSRSPERAQRLEEAIANAVKIMDAARRRGLPLFFTVADHRPDGKDTAARLLDSSVSGPISDPEAFHIEMPGPLRGRWEAQLIEEMTVRPEDTVVLKHRWSAFYETHLELSLRTLGVNTLAVLGSALEIGIASTAYSARDHDVSLIFIRDAIVASNPASEPIFMDFIFPRMGLVRTTEWLIHKLRG